MLTFYTKQPGGNLLHKHKTVKSDVVEERPATCTMYTAILRKVVGKNVHATIPKGNMGYDPYTVPDTVAVKISLIAFL